MESAAVLPELEDSTPALYLALSRGVEELGRRLEQDRGFENWKHLRRMEGWGRLCSLAGYATAWICFNPISAILISVGNFCRWSIVLHPVSHGAFDRLPDIPARYRSRNFARGFRRWLDWLDWITPEAWHLEHDILHHRHTGDPKDPDVVERNSEWIRQLRIPRWAKWSVVLFLTLTWKPLYYAPNTWVELEHSRDPSVNPKVTFATWNPLTRVGRKLWLGSVLPYVLFRFVLLPGLFLPLGRGAVLNVLLTSLLAEALTNFHSFLAIAPSHTGSDLFRFDRPPTSPGEYYWRQIVGTVNYPAGGDLLDFLHGGLNYQIEHHLWPRASLRQLQRVRPALRALCADLGIVYREQSVWIRLIETLKVVVGETTMRVE